MKFRINLGQNICDGSPIYRIYKGEGEAWIFMASEGTEERARARVHRIMNPEPEITIADFEL